MVGLVMKTRVYTHTPNERQRMYRKETIKGLNTDFLKSWVKHKFPDAICLTWEADLNRNQCSVEFFA
jgi:hypothetical protein